MCCFVFNKSLRCRWFGLLKMLQLVLKNVHARLKKTNQVSIGGSELLLGERESDFDVGIRHSASHASRVNKKNLQQRWDGHGSARDSCDLIGVDLDQELGTASSEVVGAHAEFYGFVGIDLFGVRDDIGPIAFQKRFDVSRTNECSQFASCVN